MQKLDKKAIGVRILKIQEEVKINSRQFAIAIGMDGSQLGKIEKGKLGLSQPAALVISEKYDVPLEWLLYGKGTWKYVPREQELNDPQASYTTERNNQKTNAAKKKVPFFDAEASAGSGQGDMTPIHAPAGTIDVGDLLHDSHAAIRIYGNSMVPDYPSGCVVGLAKCQSKFIEPGEVYVIETRDSRMLKRLFYKNDDADSDFITCYSDNISVFDGGSRNGKPVFPPFDLPKREIMNIFSVTGVIRRNSNSVIIKR